jgi:general secretion pathway protein G
MARPSAQRTRREPGGEGGFTLIELMTVIAIMGVLVAIALPNYKASILQSKEAVLKEDITRLRSLLDQYQADRGHYPESLEKLVEDGYLRDLPIDPMTGMKDWEIVMEDPDPSDPSATPGVYSVKSSSTGSSLSGKPYNEW